MNYKQLYALFDKNSINLKTLRSLAMEEHVSRIDTKDSDKWGHSRYDITLDNGEIYIVYIKKPISELVKILFRLEKE